MWLVAFAFRRCQTRASACSNRGGPTTRALTLTHSQELTNVLKTDRGLLSLAVALIHNCCASTPPLPPPPGEGRGDGAGGAEDEKRQQEGRGDRGRKRLGGLVADRAFCCLLMKVTTLFVLLGVPPRQLPSTAATPAAACFVPRFASEETFVHGTVYACVHASGRAFFFWGGGFGCVDGVFERDTQQRDTTCVVHCYCCAKRDGQIWYTKYSIRFAGCPGVESR